jgi:hypothetical protein
MHNQFVRQRQSVFAKRIKLVMGICEEPVVVTKNANSLTWQDEAFGVAEGEDMCLFSLI